MNIAKRRWLLYSLAAVLSFALASYAGILVYFIRLEPSIVYAPSRSILPPDRGSQLTHQTVVIDSGNNVHLSLWIISAAAPSPDWVIFFHGNAGNVSSADAWYSALRKLGVNTIAVDYRGYGQSDGVPSETGFYSDAHSAYDYLRYRRNVAADHIILYGHSLGSAVAVQLASSVSTHGLIVEGGFPSLPALGQDLYPFLPVSLLARNRFNSGVTIAHVYCPKLFLHARSDTVVPMHYGWDLYKAAPAPKEWVQLGGDHNTAIRIDNARVLQAVGSFFHVLWPNDFITSSAVLPGRPDK